MKKQLYSLKYFFFLLFIIKLTACGKVNAYQEPLIVPFTVCTAHLINDDYTSTEPLTSNDTGLHLIVDTASITPVGLYLYMVNNTRFIYLYGPAFVIEKWEDDTWVSVPSFDHGWNEPGLIVEAQFTRSQQVNWLFIYGALQPGTYRFVRSFRTYYNDWNFHPHRGLIQEYYYVPFIIGEEWANFYQQWQEEQEAHQATLAARFAGLDIDIHSYNVDEVHFTLTNNNPYYAYFISGVFIDWQRQTPNGVDRDTVYNFFTNDKRLDIGESFTTTLNWSDVHIQNRHAHRTFIINIGVTVDADYIDESLRFQLPGSHHGMWHTVRAEFDVNM